MAEPSAPVNGQNRIVEGLVTPAGVAGYKKGANSEAVTGSTNVALDMVVTLGTTPIVGALTETAPATDTASSGLNGRLQRIAQRLTSLIALLPAALGAGGGLKVDGSGTPLPVSGTVTANVGTGTLAVSATSLPLPTGAATATLQGGGLPAALGQGTMAQSLKVAVASDQSAIPVSQPGLAGGILQTVTTVGTTAVPLPASPLTGRVTMLVQNVGATTIYLGSSTVTADTAATGGVQLSPGQSLPISLAGGVVLSAISSAAGGLVATLEGAA